jgi:hypothetical protein
MVNEKPFKLNMPFEEALRRIALTDEKELPERVKLKRRKRAAGRSQPAKGRPPGPRREREGDREV